MMQLLPLLLTALLSSAWAVTARSAPTLTPHDRIEVEALVVTRAELRRHFAAGEADALRPATFQELHALDARNDPPYLVARFRSKRPGHYFGEPRIRIDRMSGPKFNVVLHYNPGWVEYFIPLQNSFQVHELSKGGPTIRAGAPAVTFEWESLTQK